MFSRLFILSAFAIVSSPTLVTAGTHDVPQRRHGHAGLSRITLNSTLAGNHTLAAREDNARLTMYYQTGNAGACGIWNSDSDFVCTCPPLVRHANYNHRVQIVALNHEVRQDALIYARVLTHRFPPSNTNPATGASR